MHYIILSTSVYILKFFKIKKKVLKDSYQYAADKSCVSGTSLGAQGLRMPFAMQRPARRTKIPHGVEDLSLEPQTTEAHALEDPRASTAAAAAPQTQSPRSTEQVPRAPPRI